VEARTRLANAVDSTTERFSDSTGVVIGTSFVIRISSFVICPSWEGWRLRFRPFGRRHRRRFGQSQCLSANFNRHALPCFLQEILFNLAALLTGQLTANPSFHFAQRSDGSVTPVEAGNDIEAGRRLDDLADFAILRESKSRRRDFFGPAISVAA